MTILRDAADLRHERLPKLYAISADSKFIKFGVAFQPRRRMIELQTASPFALTLLGQIELPDRESAFVTEKLVHLAAASDHVRGEWFHSCPKTLSIVNLMKSELHVFHEMLTGWADREIAHAEKLLSCPPRRA